MEVRIGTLNCRSLRTDDRVVELEDALSQVPFDIISLQETRRRGLHSIALQSQHHLFCYGEESAYGTGFLVHARWAAHADFHYISARLSYLDIPPLGLRLIVTYAPTSASRDEDYLSLLNDLSGILSASRRVRLPGFGTLRVILLGDLNAKVGSRVGEEAYVGRHGLGARNDRGELLVEFCEANQLHVINTRFAKRESRKWTWLSPNMQTRNAIDYVLCRDLSIFRDISIVGSFQFATDHRLLMARVRVRPTAPRRFRPPKCQGRIHFPLYSMAIEDLSHTADMSHYPTMVNIVRSAAEIATVHDKKRPRLSDRTRSLFRRRHHLQSLRSPSPRSRVEFSVTSKALRATLKEDLRLRHLEVVSEAVRYGQSTRKALQSSSIGRTQLCQLERSDGSIAATKNEVALVVKKFYDNLYAPSTPPLGLQIPTTASVPSVLPDEVSHAVARLKTGRSPGPDKITAEMLQAAGNILTVPLATLFTRCIEETAVPDSLADSCVSLLFKKGSPLDIGNYRPIALLSLIYKLLTSVIYQRIERSLSDNQPDEQAGFRRNFSTLDHIHTLSELIHRSVEYDFPLYLVFIDYKKAFDSVEFDKVWKALLCHGVPDRLVALLQKIYNSANVYARVGRERVSIDVRRGVRQGDPLSPALFAAVVEEIFRNLEWEALGVNVDGRHLHHLRYADDIVIISHSAAEASLMLRELADESKKSGLVINVKKTHILTNRAHVPMVVDGQPLSYVDSFIYLGQRVSFDLNTSLELSRRIGSAWKSFNRFHQFLTSRRVMMKHKVRVFRMCVVPALLYGAECWSTRLQDRRKLITAQRAMMRRMAGTTLLDRRTNDWLKEKVPLEDARVLALRRKWQWARRLAKMEGERWAKRMTEWQPREWARRRGRPKRRWRDDLVEALGTRWMAVAREDRDEFRRTCTQQAHALRLE